MMTYAQHDSAESSDEEIITSYMHGDEHAFKKLVHRYTAPLYNFTARLAGRTDAPDIVQESFIKAWRHLGRYDRTKASFKTWIFTIAKNTTTDFLRKKKNIAFSDIEEHGEEDADSLNSFADNIPDENPLAPELLEKLESSATLSELLEKLSPASREVLVLHYQEEMTFEEIGEILGKPANTVKSTHRRAILELRKMI